MSRWHRPNTFLFPRIYKEFEGKPSPTGIKLKFWIQDLTDEYIEEVLKLYVSQYLPKALIAKYCGILNDELCLKEYIEKWRRLFKQKITPICLTKDESGNIKLAGVNCLYVRSKYDEPLEFKSKVTKKLVDIITYFEDEANAYDRFNCEAYITAVGLVVAEEYRGNNIAIELLNARDEIAKMIGLKVSLTCFTTIPAQKQAKRAGFKDLVKINYVDFGKINENMALPGAEKEGVYASLMYKEHL